MALLPTPGEFPGFRASNAVVTNDGIAAAVSRDASVAQMQSDARHLRADGFRDDVSQVESDGGAKAAGTAFVGAFASPAAASRYRAYYFGLLSKPGPENGTGTQNTFTTFTVPGVPGSEGDGEVSTASTAVAANVQWIEGDCVFELGDASSSASAPLTTPLIAGAQAIYHRTKGACGS